MHESFDSRAEDGGWPYYSLEDDKDGEDESNDEDGDSSEDEDGDSDFSDYERKMCCYQLIAVSCVDSIKFDD